jgi:hypothetical protein
MRTSVVRGCALLLMSGATVAATPAQDQSRASLPLGTALSLFSTGPAAEHREALMLFGQFVGSWDVELVSMIPGEEGRFDGEWHFAWILQGRGVQDVWIVPKRRFGRPGRGRPQYEYGSTVRIYDPAIDAWRVNWHGPLRNNFQNFIARASGDEIVLTGGKAGSLPMRWIISDVQPESFNWRAEVSTDGGTSWFVVQTMHAERSR